MRRRLKSAVHERRRTARAPRGEGRGAAGDEPQQRRAHGRAAARTPAGRSAAGSGPSAVSAREDRRAAPYSWSPGRREELLRHLELHHRGDLVGRVGRATSSAEEDRRRRVVGQVADELARRRPARRGRARAPRGAARERVLARRARPPRGTARARATRAGPARAPGRAASMSNVSTSAPVSASACVRRPGPVPTSITRSAGRDPGVAHDRVDGLRVGQEALAVALRAARRRGPRPAPRAGPCVVRREVGHSAGLRAARGEAPSSTRGGVAAVASRRRSSFGGSSASAASTPRVVGREAPRRAARRRPGRRAARARAPRASAPRATGSPVASARSRGIGVRSSAVRDGRGAAARTPGPRVGEARDAPRPGGPRARTPSAAALETRGSSSATRRSSDRARGPGRARATAFASAARANHRRGAPAVAVGDEHRARVLGRAALREREEHRAAHAPSRGRAPGVARSARSRARAPRRRRGRRAPSPPPRGSRGRAWSARGATTGRVGGAAEAADGEEERRERLVVALDGQPLREARERALVAERRERVGGGDAQTRGAVGERVEQRRRARGSRLGRVVARGEDAAASTRAAISASAGETMRSARSKAAASSARASAAPEERERRHDGKEPAHGASESIRGPSAPSSERP